jgi:hypothetical protein
MIISQNVIFISMPCATVGRYLGIFILTLRFVFKYQISQYLGQNISVPFLHHNQTSDTLWLHIRTEDKTFRSLVGRSASAMVQTGSQPHWRVRFSPWQRQLPLLRRQHDLYITDNSSSWSLFQTTAIAFIIFALTLRHVMYIFHGKSRDTVI